MHIPIPERYVDLFEGIVASARATMENKGMLPTMAILGKFEGEGFDFMPVAGLTELPSRVAHKLICMLAEQEHADFVMSVAEVWSQPVHSDAEVKKLLSEHKRVVDMPDCRSSVYFALDTYEGSWSAIVPREGEEGHYTFGAVELRSMQSANAMFIGVLPRRDSDAIQ